MNLRLVMTVAAIRGETVRFHLNKQGLSARDLSKVLSHHEGHTSHLMSKGTGWEKHHPAVLKTIKLSESEFDAQVAQVTATLKAHGVHVKGEREQDSPFDVVMPTKTVQGLIDMSKLHVVDSKAA